MTKFYSSSEAGMAPLKCPEDVRPLLAKPKTQWRDGYSAKELACAWIGAQDFPSPVRKVLDTCPVYRGAEIDKGYFERKTPLRSAGRDSQTDLLVIARTHAGTAVMGVEGKRDEPFGDLVRKWNSSPGRQRRLETLCRYLELDPDNCGDLRYQLFHRTAAALFEAEAADAGQALILVHSFSPANTSFADFQRFTTALGAPVEAADTVGPKRMLNGISTRFGWVRDPRPTE